jgi:hypothetical protein
MIVFYVACVLFLSTFILGVSVQARVVDTKPFRWLHHALFSAVCVTAILAVAVGFLWGLPYRWELAPALILFAALPYVRAGTPGHAALAGAALILYGAGFAQTL